MRSVAKSLSHAGKFSSAVVNGGVPLGKGAKALAVPVDILVATPQRVLQHHKEGHLYFGDIQCAPPACLDCDALLAPISIRITIIVIDIIVIDICFPDTTFSAINIPTSPICVIAITSQSSSPITMAT